VASEGKTPDGTARPGKDFYKSEAEIAAIKAANKVAEGAVEASSRVANSLPDIRSLSGDWKVGAKLGETACSCSRVGVGRVFATMGNHLTLHLSVFQNFARL
jgi:hypothetical protein